MKKIITILSFVVVLCISCTSPTIEQAAITVPTLAPTVEIASSTIAPSPTQTIPAPTVIATASPEPPIAEPTTIPSPSPTAEPPPIQRLETDMRLYDFDSLQEVADWIIVNDTVMGGVSTAQGSLENSAVTLTGYLSLDNNGGFASVRAPTQLDLSAYEGLRLRVRGDGRSYYLRLRNESFYNDVTYEKSFETVAGEWVEVEIPFSQTVPTFRARILDRPPLDPADIRSIGFMLREKAEGAFTLEIDWIEAYEQTLISR